MATRWLDGRLDERDPQSQKEGVRGLLNHPGLQGGGGMCNLADVVACLFVAS